MISVSVMPAHRPAVHARRPRQARSGLRGEPILPGFMAMQPSSTAPAAFLLDINEWLRRYSIRVL
jgi:hypothetical protein